MQLVCFGCGKPTTIHEPACEDCEREISQGTGYTPRQLLELGQDDYENAMKLWLEKHRREKLDV